MDVVEVVGRGVPLVPLVTGTDLPKATVVPQQYRGRLASLHTLTKRSYKHARGPENTPGSPIRCLLIPTIIGKDKKTQWSSVSPPGGLDIILAPNILLGRPSDRVAAAIGHLELFSPFI